MKGDVQAVRVGHPQDAEGLVFLLRNLADQVEQGAVDPQDVLYAVDEPEGLFVCSLDVGRILLDVWKFVQREVISTFKPTAVVVVKTTPSREPGPNPNLVLEG